MSQDRAQRRNRRVSIRRLLIAYRWRKHRTPRWRAVGVSRCRSTRQRGAGLERMSQAANTTLRHLGIVPAVLASGNEHTVPRCTPKPTIDEQAVARRPRRTYGDVPGPATPAPAKPTGGDRYTARGLRAGRCSHARGRAQRPTRAEPRALPSALGPTDALDPAADLHPPRAGSGACGEPGTPWRGR